MAFTGTTTTKAHVLPSSLQDAVEIVAEGSFQLLWHIITGSMSKMWMSSFHGVARQSQEVQYYWYITGVMIGHSAGDVFARSRRDAVCRDRRFRGGGRPLLGRVAPKQPFGRGRFISPLLHATNTERRFLFSSYPKGLKISPNIQHYEDDVHDSA